jgi:hypothetical protein
VGKQKTLTFGKPENITPPGKDGLLYCFPFSAVDFDLIGSPEEARVSTRHRLIVEASRTKLAPWRLSDADLVKVFFEIGRRALVERVAQGQLNAEEKVIVTDSRTPYDPSRIADPNGYVTNVEPVPKRIGF